MRLRKFTLLTLIPVFFAAGLRAQTILFSENFNGCALPSGWQVNATGNQNPTWYVGISQNNDAAGQSIDGSCFLLIDDEATGNNTPGYTIDFVSPPFDASQFSTVLLTMDVHYRDWEDANEYLQILVKDGATEIPIPRFDKYRKNSASIADHFSLAYDLALVTQSPDARLIIRYNDANGAWKKPGAALTKIALLAEFGLELVEEPVHGAELLNEVQSQCSLPIAIDESATSHEAIAAAGCQAVCLKISSSGGITELLRRAVSAINGGSVVYVASMLDGPVGIAAALHTAAVLRPPLACGTQMSRHGA